MRPPIVQKHPFGCAVACVAYALNMQYAQAMRLFRNGKRYATSRGFFCKEIANELQKTGIHCEVKYTTEKIKKRIYRENTIVFIKRSDKYPAGHYLCRTKNSWMDPWINFPQNKHIHQAKAGFRIRLPGRTIYAILKN